MGRARASGTPQSRGQSRQAYACRGAGSTPARCSTPQAGPCRPAWTAAPAPAPARGATHGTPSPLGRGVPGEAARRAPNIRRCAGERGPVRPAFALASLPACAMRSSRGRFLAAGAAACALHCRAFFSAAACRLPAGRTHPGGHSKGKHAVGKQVGIGQQRGGEDKVGKEPGERLAGAQRVPARPCQQALHTVRTRGAPGWSTTGRVDAWVVGARC